jgi:hypothetical protein
VREPDHLAPVADSSFTTRMTAATEAPSPFLAPFIGSDPEKHALLVDPPADFTSADLPDNQDAGPVETTLPKHPGDPDPNLPPPDPDPTP